jgi:hypothetical protein
MPQAPPCCAWLWRPTCTHGPARLVSKTCAAGPSTAAGFAEFLTCYSEGATVPPGVDRFLLDLQHHLNQGDGSPQHMLQVRQTSGALNDTFYK